MSEHKPAQSIILMTVQPRRRPPLRSSNPPSTSPRRLHQHPPAAVRWVRQALQPALFLSLWQVLAQYLLQQVPARCLLPQAQAWHLLSPAPPQFKCPPQPLQESPHQYQALHPRSNQALAQGRLHLLQGARPSLLKEFPHLLAPPVYLWGH